MRGCGACFRGKGILIEDLQNSVSMIKVKACCRRRNIPGIATSFFFSNAIATSS